MRLIFLGPPGVGKGTQAKQICEHYKIIHLSTGEILRKEIFDKSLVGNEAKTYIDNGNLVPDKLILGIIENRLKENDTQQGYLLDGFPRTISQAEGFQKITLQLKHRLNGVISLTANEEELIKRLIKRGKDSGRSDESPEIIRHRQKVYWKQTAPLLEYYTQEKILKKVDGLGNITDITKRILETIS
ncbi:MAG: adenylate kinase [Candidatus Marinimicrobia bacterium]|jgi:adenylate kinase|nr:adenylate kinase [Candidatus Neomarinimicrobiota bacterium]